MLSLQEENKNKCIITLKSYFKKPLQVLKPHDNKSILLNKGLVGRTSFFASLTLEAALIMPVFFYAISAILWFFVIFAVQFKVDNALWEVSCEISGYGFLYDKAKSFTEKEIELPDMGDLDVCNWIAGGISKDYVKGKLVKCIGEDKSLWKVIRNGKEGMSLEELISIYNKDGIVALNVRYEIDNPFLPGGIGRQSFSVQSRIRAFTGYDYRDNNDVKVMVYVTKNGVVYHIKRDCTYLKAKIETTYTLTGIVWRNGKLYRPCSICATRNLYTNRKVYITETGVCYHSQLSCSTLNKTVFEIALEEAGEYRPCSRCGVER